MTIGQSSLADASISELATRDGSGKKVPARRTAIAVADRKPAPEAR